MKALVGAFNQEKALVGAFSVIVKPVVEPMDRFTALVITLVRLGFLYCDNHTVMTSPEVPGVAQPRDGEVELLLGEGGGQQQQRSAHCRHQVPVRVQGSVCQL